jgi:23S rRNA (pseudouridine1915-N3)-methyltransferase
MKVQVVIVSRGFPPWLQDGIKEYGQRLPKFLLPNFTLVAPVKDGHGNHNNIDAEGNLLLRNIAEKNTVIALDRLGQPWDSIDFAKKLQSWQMNCKGVSFLIGGANGLSARCQERAEHCWSLSQLTFPHNVAAILLVEQLYRAWTYLCGHPYHK